MDNKKTDNKQVDSQDKQGVTRRNLVKGMAATPLLTTVSSSVWATGGSICTVSGNLSGNLSNHEQIEDCGFNLLSHGALKKDNGIGVNLYNLIQSGLTPIPALGKRDATPVHQFLVDNGFTSLATALATIIADDLAALTFAGVFKDYNSFPDYTGQSNNEWLMRALQAIINAMAWDTMVLMYEAGNTSNPDYQVLANSGSGSVPGLYFPAPSTDPAITMSTYDWVRTVLDSDVLYFVNNFTYIELGKYENMS